jgi:hypothetical protein
MAMSPSPYHNVSPSKRPNCPVCHKAVYSRAGIHPQCAAHRQEAAQKLSQKQLKQTIQASLDDA